MKYALVNNQRVEAEKGLKAICPCCGNPVTAKCGEVRKKHWAHIKTSHCDKWWESETLWHRTWKNLFPSDWQEIISYDEQSGEKHIADIKTPKGMVVEFQHSYIKPEECHSREMFYKDMVWVVDGKRLQRDYKRFIKAFQDGEVHQIQNRPVFLIDFPEEHLPNNWLNSSKPVFIDFNEIQEAKEFIDTNRFMPCILPSRDKSKAVIFLFSRNEFMEKIRSGGFDFNYKLIDDWITTDLNHRRPITIPSNYIRPNRLYRRNIRL